jgi:hypothetical protein
MATISTTPEVMQTSPAVAPLLVCLASTPPEALDMVLRNLTEAFSGGSIIVATEDASALPPPSIQLVKYTPPAASPGAWTLVAADFLNAHELSARHQAKAVLLLGAEAQSLTPKALRDLANSIFEGKTDLAVPRYALPPRSGLVNSAILYPVSRALFGAAPRYPLALDLGLSPRMAERLATAAQRFTASNQADAILWPVAEAAVANFQIEQVDAGFRTLPQPAGADLNSILALVGASLFADVDAKAAFWQRARVAQTLRPEAPRSAAHASTEDVQPMLDAFLLAYQNLFEIWALVLPPQSLLGIKRLSAMPAATFAMPDSLWARIVYDFLLAYRLRTIHRGHLLGALTPLYLAWVASHILLTRSGTDPDRHIESIATAFETDKAYLVSRWRWPDRFNP